MKFEFKKLFLIRFILAITLVITGFSNLVLAQDDENTDDSVQEESAPEENNREDNHEAARVDENSPAHRVLGRQLTAAEHENYGKLDEISLENQLLYKEQRLVIVRALVAIGEGDDVEAILNKLPTIRKTFIGLVEEFTELKEKYGTVIKGVDSVYGSNNKNDEYAFNEAAHEAFQTVFCKALEGEEEAQFLKYFKDKDSLTYSKMVAELQSIMTDDVKKNILFKILNDIGRPDLQTNQKFVNKILSQSFTCANLSRLLKEVK